MTDIFFEELNKGHWNIVILIIFFIAIIMALKQYTKMNETRHKEHDVRHKENESMCEVMSKNLIELTKITAVHENRIHHSEDDIKEIKDDIRNIKR